MNKKWWHEEVHIGSFGRFIAQTATTATWEAVSHMCSLFDHVRSYHNVLMIHRFESGHSQFFPIKRQPTCMCNQ